MKLSYLGLTEGSCPYIAGNTSITEGIIIPDAANDELDALLEQGFRHFGPFYFRPVCRNCHRCIPIRVPLAGYLPSRSARRLQNRNSTLVTRLGPPHSIREAYDLYVLHKHRFGDGRADTYRQFIESFYYPHRTAHILCSYDGDRLVRSSSVERAVTV